MGEAYSNGGYCMFDNWYVVQIRTGKEEIVKKCQLLDCFIPITKKKKKYQGSWHIVDDILLRDISL